MSMERNVEGKDSTPSRRDFMGKVCVGSFVGAIAACAVGAANAVKPSVTPDPSEKFKIGMPEDYLEGAIVNFEEENVLLFRDKEGIHAISTVCTHLGCIVAYDEAKGFACPCHGSKFDKSGEVTHGPAPVSLSWLEVAPLPSGQLAVDRSKTVPMGTKLSV